MMKEREQHATKGGGSSVQSIRDSQPDGRSSNGRYVYILEFSLIEDRDATVKRGGECIASTMCSRLKRVSEGLLIWVAEGDKLFVLGAPTLPTNISSF